MREKDIIIFIFLPLFHKVYFRRLPVCVFTSEGYQFVTSEGKEWMYLLQKVAQVEESSVVLRVNIQRSPVINFSLLCLVSQGAQIIQSTGMSRVQSIQKHRGNLRIYIIKWKHWFLTKSMKETGVLRCILAIGNASISRQNHWVSNCSHAHIHTHLPEGCFIMVNGFLVSSLSFRKLA